MNYVQVLKPLHQHPSADDFMAPTVDKNVVAVANGGTWKMLRNVRIPIACSSATRKIRQYLDIFGCVVGRMKSVDVVDFFFFLEGRP